MCQSPKPPCFLRFMTEMKKNDVLFLIILKGKLRSLWKTLLLAKKWLFFFVFSVSQKKKSYEKKNSLSFAYLTFFLKKFFSNVAKNFAALAWEFFFQFFVFKIKLLCIIHIYDIYNLLKISLNAKCSIYGTQN